MHHTNFYDTYPGFAPRPLPPGEPPRPLTGWERKSLRKASRKPGRRRTGLLIFAILLLMLGGGVTGLLYLSQNVSTAAFRPILPFTPPSSAEDPYFPWGDYDLEAPRGPTTIERAPLAQGVSLALHPARGEALAFQEIYDKCISSIVSVRTSITGSGATGTGVVLSQDGYIVTNYHVIEGGYRVDVVLENGRSCKALLVGGDQTNDLAVLKIDATGLTPAEFGSSDSLRVGDPALAIGNPLGEELRGTMTDGIISAINRDVHSDGNTMSLIQTTAALNSGNSGGALINAYGQVVGITNMKMMSDYNTIEGLGFAIPSTTTKTVVDALLSAGYLGGRPTIGITGQALSKEDAELEELVPGVYVATVDEKSDAWKQGMRVGDVITQCQGEKVSSVEDINAIKAGMVAGDSLALTVYREGEYLELDVLLMERHELDN